jgi:hypothetical protein
MAWSTATPLAARWHPGAGNSSGRAGGSSRAGLPGREPGSAAPDPPPGLIDSSFFRLYTGPPKPPVVGDLAGSERGFHAGGFGAATQGREEPEAAESAARSCGPPSLLKFFSDTSWSSASAEEYDGRIPVGGHHDSFLRFSVAWRAAAGRGQRMERRSLVASSPDDSSPRRRCRTLSDLHSLRSDHAVLRHRPRNPAGPCRSFVSERTRSRRDGSRQRIAVKQ